MIPAVVSSGLPCDRFCFEGFLPQKKGRASRIEALKEETRTMVFYESPYRVLKTLEQLAAAFGGDRRVSACREISKVPEEYKDIYKEEGIVIHKCIRYTDNAIRRFFEKAKTQSWYKNTLFVITSDHTNLSDHAYYQTDLGGFCSPIIFFDPSGDMKPAPTCERRITKITRTP